MNLVEEYILKRSKEKEKFSISKFKKSLEECGVDKQNSEDVVKELSLSAHQYFSTDQLHKATYKALLKRSALYAANYNIKRAIYQLGPTGYPFEILCAAMLEAKGYETEVSKIKKGQFITHEVDVIGRRDDHNIYCEVKFHNKKYHKNDVKIPLYVHSRYLDLKAGIQDEVFDYAVISNTAFSKDAITYSEGVGLLLFSMNYPHKDNFVDHIKRYKLYPITALKSLKVSEKKKLLDKKIVMIKHIQEDDLEALGISQNRKTKIFQEIKILTRPN